MKIPVMRGIIDRRILVNYRVDAGVMANYLPEPFRPQLVHGYAIGGICLIRLKNVRPRFLPFHWGLNSENAAHRIAVEWDVDGETRHGVYIPRRDTSSRLNTWAGGRLFPGSHQLSTFDVHEEEGDYSVTIDSRDRKLHLHVSAKECTELPDSSIFDSLEETSAFFEEGSLGYSVTPQPGKYDGLELRCKNWHVKPLDVTKVESSFFDDEKRFPPGAVEFDCALLMRGIEHEWHSREELCCSEAAGV